MRSSVLAAALLTTGLSFGERMGGAKPWGYPEGPVGYDVARPAYVRPGSGKKHQRKAKAKIAKASKKRNRK